MHKQYTFILTAMCIKMKNISRSDAKQAFLIPYIYTGYFRMYLHLKLFFFDWMNINKQKFLNLNHTYS